MPVAKIARRTPASSPGADARADARAPADALLTAPRRKADPPAPSAPPVSPAADTPIFVTIFPFLPRQEALEFKAARNANH
jgi:hypothetical protein